MLSQHEKSGPAFKSYIMEGLGNESIASCKKSDLGDRAESS
jgi:hypothetical protein